jgi:hypothetical protein
MQVLKPDLGAVYSRSNQFILKAIILLVFVAVGLSACSASKALETTTPAPDVLTQSDLEAQYGLRVNLVAVTGAGGFVDVRLKMVDAEKAKSLLQDPKNFPSLWIADSDVTLNASDETKAQEISYQNDGNLFILFPNAGNVVKPGKPVTLKFGEIQVEPINSN